MFLPLLSERANLYKQHPQDAVLQRYSYLFYCLHSRHTFRRYMKQHISGLPATQAGREMYMPLIQYPEGYCLDRLALSESKVVHLT